MATLLDLERAVIIYAIVTPMILLFTEYKYKTIAVCLLVLAVGVWVASWYWKEIKDYATNKLNINKPNKIDNSDTHLKNSLVGNWIEDRNNVTLRYSFHADGNWKVTVSGDGVKGALIAAGNAAGLMELSGLWSLADGVLTMKITRQGQDAQVDAFNQLVHALMGEDRPNKVMTVRIEHIDGNAMRWDNNRKLTRIGVY